MSLAARRVLVGLAVLLVGVQAFRNAAVAAWGVERPAAAAKLWGDHPTVEINGALTEIAAATRAGRPTPGAAVGRLRQAALRAPLAPQPFLAAGVDAQLAGDQSRALALFEAAQRRDPRSLPARYFLAGQYLSAGDLRSGLEQFAVLARIAPGAIAAVTPFVAQFASDRRNWDALRGLFRANPTLEETTLAAMAQDPANAPAILALADNNHRSLASSWAVPLLSRMTDQGRFAEARALWAELANVRDVSGLLLYDPQFEHPGRSPFQWQLTSSPLGLAERQPEGRLHLLYYGEDMGVLAKQMLVLAPGRYRLDARLEAGGTHAEAVGWAAQCAGTVAAPDLARVPDVAARGFLFDVPAGCKAIWLQLIGNPADLPQQSDFTISGLRLMRVSKP